MDPMRIIEKYIEIVEHPSFIKHWKQLSERLISGISRGYRQGYREPEIVKAVNEVINSIDNFESPGRFFNIITSSIFIHGNISFVNFKYYGTETTRELGDIIFIISIVYNEQKYFEKMTITQIKKSPSIFWKFNNNSAREQLYLLSRFPPFRGTKGSIVPQRNDYKLPNYSGCLGSYGLFYSPGDMVFSSAKHIESLIIDKHVLKWRDVISIREPETANVSYYRTFEEQKVILANFWRYCNFFNCNLFPVLGNSCLAHNAFDFSDKYLRGFIGELIYASGYYHDENTLKFLMDLLEAVREKGGELKEFVEKFLEYPYNPIGKDFYDPSNSQYNNFHKEGGLGLVHTTIKLNGAKHKHEDNNSFSWM